MMMAGGTYIGALLGWRMSHLYTLYLDRNGQKAGLTGDTCLFFSMQSQNFSFSAPPLHALSLAGKHGGAELPQEQKQKLSDFFKDFEPSWQHFCSILSFKPSNRVNLCSLWEHKGLHTQRGGLLEAVFGDSYQEGPALFSYSSF